MDGYAVVLPFVAPPVEKLYPVQDVAAEEDQLTCTGDPLPTEVGEALIVHEG